MPMTYYKIELSTSIENRVARLCRRALVIKMFQRILVRWEVVGMPILLLQPMGRVALEDK